MSEFLDCTATTTTTGTTTVFCGDVTFFYGINVGETDDDPLYRGINTVKFNSTDFYVTQNSPDTDTAIVNFRGTVTGGNGEANTASNLPGDEGIFFQKTGVDLEFKSLSAGTNITLSSDNDAITITSSGGAGFYGLSVKETDGDPAYKGINTLNFQSDWFYLTQNSPNTDEATINFRGVDPSTGEANTASNLGSGEGAFFQKTGVDLEFKSFVGGHSINLSSDNDEITIDSTAKEFYGITVKEDSTVIAKTDSLQFEADDFDLSTQDGDVRVAISVDIARQSDLPPGFYGVIVQESDGSNTQAPDDTIQFAVNDFVVSDNAGKPLVSLESDIARASDIGPGFYGVIFKESEVGGFVDKNDTLTFDSNDFYLSTGGDSKPLVSLIDKGFITADNVGPGFYGINVGETDEDPVFSGINTIKFNSDDFYVTQNDPNTDTTIVNFRGIPAGTGEANTASNTGSGEGVFSTKVGVDLQFKSLTASGGAVFSSTASEINIDTSAHGPGFYGITVKEDSTVIAKTDSLQFEADDFDLSTQDGDVRIVASSNIARQSDLPPGFYGVVFKESETGGFTDQNDTLTFDSNDFYLTTGGDQKPLVSLIDKEFITADDVGPGFYGITVGETDGDPIYKGINTIKFNSTDFYVTQNDPNTDEATVNFRGLDPSTGEANTASNLGSGEGVFAQKDGVDLQFKSLVAGHSIDLSSTSTEITIDSTAREFYGITVKEDSTVIAKTDSLQFEADDFDLSTQDGDVRVVISTDIARQSDLPPGFYGVIVQESDGSNTQAPDDTIQFAVADFVVSDNSGKPLVTLESDVARTSDIGPGFYGVVFKESEAGGFVDKSDTLTFDSNDFYLSTGGDSKPLVSLIDKGFITSEDVGPGFYGIIVEDTDLNKTFKTDIVRFRRADFYLTEDSLGRPIVNAAFVSGGEGGDGNDQIGTVREAPTGGTNFSNVNTLIFNTDSGFYLSSPSATVNFHDHVVDVIAGSNISVSTSQTNAAKTITVNADVGLNDIPPGFYGITVKEDASVIAKTDSLQFEADDFDLSTQDGDVRIAISTDIARQSDIGPGFYGVVFEESDLSPSLRDDTLRFLTGDFVLSEVSDKPQVALDSSVARLTDVGPGFYGIVVKEDSTVVTTTDSLQFEADDFDVSTQAGDARVVISSNIARQSDLPPGFYGIIVQESDESNTQAADDTIQFAVADFVVSDNSGKPLVSLESDVARTSDIGPGFYGIIVQESDGSNTQAPDDTIQFAVNDFVVSDNSGKPLVTLESDVARLTDIPPGFYGITVGETDDDPIYRNINVIKFNSEDFYVTQNDPNTDTAIVNFRGTTAGGGGGEANTASNRGTGEGVFFQKSGVDLEFKSLIGGDSISLSSDDDEITINSTARQFYGVVFEDGNNFFKTDHLSFNDTQFYLSSDLQGHPVVNLVTDPGVTLKQAFATSAEWQFTHNFNSTPVLWNTFDDNDLAILPDKVDVSDPNIAYFYFTPNTAGTAIIASGLVSGADISGEANTASNLGSGEGVFAQKNGIDLEFKSITVSGGAIISSSSTEVNIDTSVHGPGFYGITVKEDSTVIAKTDSLQFEADDFDLSTQDGDVRIVASSNIARQSDLPPGFYGINVGETDDTPVYKGIDTVKFNSDDFYVTQQDTSTAIINFRGDNTTASNLTGDEGVFFQQVGDDLQFKSLTAGTNVTLSSTDDAITINSTGGGGAGTGFYGITAKHTDDSSVFRGINVFAFNVGEFYLTQNAPNTDEVTVNLRSGASRTTVQEFGDSVEWQLTHNFNTVPVLWNTFDTGDEAIIPHKVDVSDPNIAYFYFVPSIAGKAIVASGLAQDDPGSGEANTASNLGAGEGVFFQKSGVDLEFKSLTVSGGAIISSDNDEINIDTSAHGPGFYGITVKEDSTVVGVTDSLQFEADDFDLSTQDGDVRIVASSNIARQSDLPPGFYGINVKETDGDPSYKGINTFNFESTWFYLTQNSPNTDEATINFRGVDPSTGEANTASNLGSGEGVFAQKNGVDLEFKSLTASGGAILSSSSTEINIDTSAHGPGFYGITVKEDSTVIAKTDSLQFEADDFDLSTQDGDVRIVASSNIARQSDLPPAFYGIIVQESDGSNTQDPDDTIQFAVNDFVVSDNSGKPLVSLESDVARTSDIGPGFYGVAFKESEAGGFVDKNDTLTFDSNDFYLTSGGDSKPLVSLIDKGFITADNVGPGFYGITAKHQDDSASFSGLNLFSFEEQFFYLTQNPGNTDEVQIHLRNLPGAAAGEANTASNLPGDEGIFFQKTGVDLEFKSLSAGTNITLSSTDDAITINSTGGGGAGGFYGITAKHTDDSESFRGLNVLGFNVNDFYLTQNLSNTDEVIINLRENLSDRTVVQSFTNSTEWQVTHNLNTSPVLWNTFLDSDEAIIPHKADVSDPNIAYFYFIPAFSGKAIVASGLADSNPVPGEANTASNLGIGTGLFAQKNGIDLEFKSLLPGSGVGFAVTDTDVTLDFYGLSFVKETDGSPILESITTIAFNSDDFYVTQNTDKTAIVNFRGSNEFIESSITIESPTASEDIGLFFTPDAITINRIYAVTRGTTPSVTIDPRHSTDRSAAGNQILGAATAITSTTTGQTLVPTGDPTVPASSWVWLETTAQSGTVNELTVTIRYTKD